MLHTMHALERANIHRHIRGPEAHVGRGTVTTISTVDCRPIENRVGHTAAGGAVRPRTAWAPRPAGDESPKKKPERKKRVGREEGRRRGEGSIVKGVPRRLAGAWHAAAL